MFTTIVALICSPQLNTVLLSCLFGGLFGGVLTAIMCTVPLYSYVIGPGGASFCSKLYRGMT